ncbi:helix-turn-helix domain-containing protein [Runella sp.]|uniref:helix-turn-helix domain-containing protein n=1 Tax=Runella sp. TaxID=1960881 RepID=UPI003016FB1C
MAAQIVTTEDFEEFKKELLGEINQLFDLKLGNVRRWLKSDEVQRMLKVSPGTLQTLRLNGTIPFTKVGGTIFYDLEDINRILTESKQQH